MADTISDDRLGMTDAQRAQWQAYTQGFGEQEFEDLWQRAAVQIQNGGEVHVASVDDRTAMKRAAGRPKDQAHLLELERIQQMRQNDPLTLV